MTDLQEHAERVLELIEEVQGHLEDYDGDFENSEKLSQVAHAVKELLEERERLRSSLQEVKERCADGDPLTSIWNVAQLALNRPPEATQEPVGLTGYPNATANPAGQARVKPTQERET